MLNLFSYLVFFLSGISGLLYQVIWVRLFGNVFGNTVYSASLVTAVFMLGLGVGSYVVGRWIDARYAARPLLPLRMYGWSELLIAALAVAVALVLPRLTEISAEHSSYVVGEHGWHYLSPASHALRYVLAAVLLAPLTFLMGGTLTLLIRFLVARDVTSAGWRVGLLYGVNTLGAAAGSFSSDLVLIPAIGVFNTELVAVALNALAGVTALGVAAFYARSALAMPARPRARAMGGGAPGESRDALRLTAVALLLSGFAALGIEIVWFRYFASLLGGYRSVFSVLLGVVLVGIWFGSTLGAYLSRRWDRPDLGFIVVQTLFVLSTLALLAAYDPRGIHSYLDGIVEVYREGSATTRALLDHLGNIRVVALVVAAPAMLMGFAFPLANAHVQRIESEVGERAGLLYLANTAGNVLGALLAGFVLLPLFGVQTSVSLLMACALASCVPLALSWAGAGSLTTRARAERRLGVLACLICGGVGLALFATLPRDHLARTSFSLALESDQEVLALHEGVNETLMVVDLGDRNRTLYTNGHSMSGTSARVQRYMRAFSHFPLLSMRDPRRVLVLCFGVGNTLHAASLHSSVTDLHLADLSKDILEHAHLFAAHNRNVLSDPRVSVFVNDGRHHLLMQQPDFYDLVTLEPPPIAFAGLSSLYSREFYELARSRLVDGGYLTQWLPAYQLPEHAVLAMVAAFVEVFPNAVLLHTSPRELALVGRNARTNQLPLARMNENLARNPQVRADLDRVLFGSLTEIVGTFAGSSKSLARATRETAALTDDRPVNEYAVRGQLFDHRLPEALFDVDSVASWCPECFAGTASGKQLKHLPAYLAMMDELYINEQFLRYRNTHRDGKPSRFNRPALDASRKAALASSPYLQILFSTE